MPSSGFFLLILPSDPTLFTLPGEVSAKHLIGKEFHSPHPLLNLGVILTRALFVPTNLTSHHLALWQPLFHKCPSSGRRARVRNRVIGAVLGSAVEGLQQNQRHKHWDELTEETH